MDKVDDKMCNEDKTTYFLFHKGQRENPLFIEAAGMEYCSPCYEIDRKNAEVSVLCLVVSGEGVLFAGRDTITLRAGDAFIWRKGVPQHYKVNPENPWAVLWFNISGELFPTLMDAYQVTRLVYRSVPENVSRVFYRGLKLCLQTQDMDALQSRLNLLIAEIIMRFSDLSEQREYSSECRSMLDYLDRQLSSRPIPGFSQDKLANDLMLSKRHLSRIFKAETGITPCEYMAKKRAELAQRYLYATTMSVSEISFALGFCDPYYFSKFFKQRFGCSPRTFRRSKGG